MLLSTRGGSRISGSPQARPGPGPIALSVVAAADAYSLLQQSGLEDAELQDVGQSQRTSPVGFHLGEVPRAVTFTEAEGRVGHQGPGGA